VRQTKLLVVASARLAASTIGQASEVPKTGASVLGFFFSCRGNQQKSCIRFLLFASNADSSYIPGEILTVLGGETTAQMTFKKARRNMSNRKELFASSGNGKPEYEPFRGDPEIPLPERSDPKLPEFGDPPHLTPPLQDPPPSDPEPTPDQQPPLISLL
jgi:hypothetical protein